MSTYVSMLLTRLPTLLVYLAAAVLCVIYWARAPRGAMFALIGLVLQMLASLVGVAMSVWMMQSRTGPTPMPAVTVGQIAMIFQVATMILHMAGVALLVIAVFAGRERLEPSGFEVAPLRPLNR
jgi:hypothetical protein